MKELCNELQAEDFKKFGFGELIWAETVINPLQFKTNEGEIEQVTDNEVIQLIESYETALNSFDKDEKKQILVDLLKELISECMKVPGYACICGCTNELNYNDFSGLGFGENQFWHLEHILGDARKILINAQAEVSNLLGDRTESYKDLVQ